MVNVQKQVKSHGQGHTFKIYGNMCHQKGLVIRNIYAKYESPLRRNKLWPMLKFFKTGQRSWSSSRVQDLWYSWKGLVIRKPHMPKYESPIS